MPSSSVKQQRYMGMVHACQKYGKCASAAVRKTASSIKPSDAEDFARTKHKGLPLKVKKKKSFKEWLQERDLNLFEYINS